MARIGLTPILFALGAWSGVLGSDFNKYAGGPDAEVNAAAARNALVHRLPIGSNINEYSKLFRASGGSCIDAVDVNFGVNRCRYTHAIGFLAQAEWIVEIKFDKITGKSTDISVNYYVTSL